MTGTKRYRTRLLAAASTALFLCGPAGARPAREVSPRAAEHIRREVAHELVLLPRLGVFDNLAYQVNGSEVTLVGQVTRPTLKWDAENAVKRIDGVEHISNLIEVLPLSPFDNTLRLRLYNAIYGYAPLQKYALGTSKPIRIMVKNGHVRLEGAVDSEADKSIAGIRASGVADVFSVSNHLEILK